MAERLDFDALGLGGMPKWVAEGARVVRTTGVARAAGAVAGLAIDAATWIARLPAYNLDATGLGLPPGTELDELWTTARNELGASPVRDSVHFAARFEETDGLEQDESPYMFVNTRDGAGGRLIGVAAVRRPRASTDPRLGTVRVATISELLFPPERADAGLAILGAIESAARTVGADAITCMTSHPALVGVLRRQGYLPLAGNVHFFVRDVTGTAQWPTDLAQWWLGRGDGESDASF
jgi:hypothetical protein